MTNRLRWFAPVVMLSVSCCLGQFKLTTREFQVTVDEQGSVSSLLDRARAKEYLAPGQSTPLLTIKRGEQRESPSSATFASATGRLMLKYAGSGVEVELKATQKEGHLVLEIVDVRPSGRIEAAIWGPFRSTINKTVGEIVGVVRDDHFAIGIQALNVKTVGGYSLNDEGVDPSRGRAAELKEWGSVLQAYSLDRSRERTITVWNGQWPNMLIPAMKGETVIGSKIALFGCPGQRVLERIGEIEVAEGLPHPLIDGVWSKLSPETGRSYLIADYSEETIDELLGFTKRANLMTLYHMEPFVSWGHFELNRTLFPKGIEGMRTCAEKAQAMGIRLGAHVLANFIQTNDPYVTPVPDPRLMKTGSSSLVDDIDTARKEITIASPEFFDNEAANWLHTVVIDQELIRYRAVSKHHPWILQDCERGAFGTKAAAHQANAAVGKLADHPYKIFFPNIDLQNEIARNLAKRFNETGLSQMDFDGREGCWASGQGDYAQDLFTKVFYDNLDHTVINGTSTSSHFYWHINTYCNWGEPWYGGFRESMQEYRINNQSLFSRNYLPNMLGWYLLTETTSLSEMEWMLARAAGYNAGFAMATSLEALRKNPLTDTLLIAIREWEDARRAGAFTDAQRALLRNSAKEFHLEKVSAGVWNLYPLHISEEFLHTQRVRQPEESSVRVWQFVNPDADQPLQFRMRVGGSAGSINNVVLTIDKSIRIELPIRANVGESLVCDGTNAMRLYDSTGRQTRTVTVAREIPILSRSTHDVALDCEFADGDSIEVAVKFVTRGNAEYVRR